MNTWIRRTVQVGLLSAGFVLVGAAAAQAHDGDTTINKGFVNGNKLIVPIQIPVNVCGNAIALIGKAAAACEGGAAARIDSRKLTHHERAAVTRTLSEGRDLRRNGPDGSGILPGNLDTGPDDIDLGPDRDHGPDHGHGPDRDWDDCRSDCHGDRGHHGDLTINKGFLNGNLVKIPVQVPINVCGNAIAFIGKAEAACVGGAVAHIRKSARDSGDTTVNAGWLNGNKLKVPVQVPVNVSGNALALIGKAAAYSAGGSVARLG